MANTFPKNILELEDIDENMSDQDFQAIVCRLVKDEFGNHTKVDYGYSIRFASSVASVPRSSFVDYDARHQYSYRDNRPPTFAFFNPNLKNKSSWYEQAGRYVNYTQREVSGRQRTHDDDLEVELSHTCIFYNVKYATYEYCKFYKLWAFLNPKGWIFKNLLTEEEKAEVLANDSTKQKKMNEYLKKDLGLRISSQPGVMAKDAVYTVSYKGNSLASYNFCVFDTMNDKNVWGIRFTQFWTGETKYNGSEDSFVPYTELTEEIIDEKFKTFLERVEKKLMLTIGTVRMRREQMENKT